MRLGRSSLACTLLTLVVSGCIGGTGTGLTGIGNGGGTQTRALSFTSQPSNANEGETITPAIQVAALDTASQVDTSFSRTVTVTLATNTTGATLSGTRSVIAVAGVATFGDLSIDRAGSYTLRVTGGSATAATSTGFTITTVATTPAPPR